MKRTVLRAFTGLAGDVHALHLPDGVRRVTVRPDLSSTRILVSFDKAKLERGIGIAATEHQPYDSQWHQRERGPIFFRSDQPGTQVRADVWHVAPDLDVGGYNGDATEYKAILEPQPYRAAASTDADFGGTFPYAHSWMEEENWPDPEAAVTSLVGNDTAVISGITTTSSLLQLSGWRCRTSPVPTGATITRIAVNLLCRMLKGSEQDPPPDIDVNLSHLSLMNAGRYNQSFPNYNYVGAVENPNPLWPNGDAKWLRYEARDNLLWDDTWAADDFDVGSDINPTVVVTPVQHGSGAQNEQQLITLHGGTSSGNFKISWDSGGGPSTTAAIAANASAATVDSALEAVWGAGNFTVTGSDGGPYTVEFTGAYALSNESMMWAGSGYDTGMFGVLVGIQSLNRDDALGHVWGQILDGYVEVFYTP